MTDEEIDTSEIPSLREDFFKNAQIRWPGNKQQITLRIDPDILDFFKKQGKGDQSMTNEVLRKYADAQRQ